MADSTYRVGVLLDLAAGRFRRGAKAAAKDTARLGGTLRKAGGDGSLMGRRVAEGARGARREVRRADETTRRLGRTLRQAGRDGGLSVERLARRTKTLRTEMGLAARTAGRLRGSLLGVAGIAGGGFAVASGLKRVISWEQRMERLGIQSGHTTEEMARFLKEANRIASLPEIRLDTSQLIAAVEAYVEKTGDLQFARDNLELFAQAIQGSGGTGDAVGRLSAELRKLGVTDAARALNLWTAQGKEGAFTIGNMAAQGERLVSAFDRLKYRGEGAVRQLGAISQMARQSTGSSEQAATAVEALLRTMSDAQKIDAIWSELGVNVRDAAGAFRPLDRILKEVIGAVGGDITQLSGIFDAKAIRAVSGLTTARGLADYERFLTIEAPQDMLARDAARYAQTTGAKIQETKTDVEDWMQDKLTGPLGEVVTALTSFKDELLVGVGLLAGSWYAFKGLRAAGRLFWRLAGRGAPGAGGLKPAAGGGSGPVNRGGLSGGRTEPAGTGPTTRHRNDWRAALRRAAEARAAETAAATREAAARRTATLTRTEPAGTGPTTRPNNAPPKLLPAYAGGLWRTLSRGLGPASVGAVMGLTAHDIATGAIPDDQVAPEVGGVMGGLGGFWAAANLISKFTGRLPGPIRFGSSLLSGVAGYMGGESVGQAAAKVAFDPGWTSPWAWRMVEKLDRWLNQPASDPPLEIGNWRAVGEGEKNRGRLDIGQNEPEVWTPPAPADLDSDERRPNRGRLSIGRNEVTVNVGPITVESAAADPREVADEVVDEIERRLRGRGALLRDVLLDDPSPEASY